MVNFFNSNRSLCVTPPFSLSLTLIYIVQTLYFIYYLCPLFTVSFLTYVVSATHEMLEGILIYGRACSMAVTDTLLLSMFNASHES